MKHPQRHLLALSKATSLLLGSTTESLVRQSSTKPSRTNGGFLDWVMLNPMLPMVANIQRP